MAEGENPDLVSEFVEVVESDVARAAIRDDELAEATVDWAASERMAFEECSRFQDSLGGLDDGLGTVHEEKVEHAIEVVEGPLGPPGYRHVRAFGRATFWLAALFRAHSETCSSEYPRRVR